MTVERRTIVRQVGLATVKIRPVGFALYAEEFLIAGASLPEKSRARGNTEFTPVPFYLIGRSLELIFKAYLITTGMTENVLARRAYGHNLEVLWRAASASGIAEVLESIPAHFPVDLAALNSYYNSKNFEYFDFHRWAHGYEGLPPLLRLTEATQEIVGKTKKYVFAVS